MESRTNNLFKSYLQENAISTSPSPEPQVTKFKESVLQSQQNILNKSVSQLCAMMENCTVQLQMSNEIMTKFVSPNSDFIIVQKNQLKEFLNEFRQDLAEFKSDIKKDLNVLSKEQQLVKSEDQLNQPSQKSIFSCTFKPDVPSSQASLFSNKPLTPPSSFEAMLKARKLDTFASVPHAETQFKSPVKLKVKQERNNGNRRSMSKPPSQITYKLEKKRKPPECKQMCRSPSVRAPSKNSSVSSRMENTQNWLDSLPKVPLPPVRKSKKSLDHLRTSGVDFKRVQSREPEDSDNESLTSKWSSRSVRTVKSRNKRGARFVKVERVARSELGWGGWGCHEPLNCERKYRSEY